MTSLLFSLLCKSQMCQRISRKIASDNMPLFSHFRKTKITSLLWLSSLNQTRASVSSQFPPQSNILNFVAELDKDPLSLCILFIQRWDHLSRRRHFTPVWCHLLPPQNPPFPFINSFVHFVSTSSSFLRHHPHISLCGSDLFTHNSWLAPGIKILPPAEGEQQNNIIAFLLSSCGETIYLESKEGHPWLLRAGVLLHV